MGLQYLSIDVKQRYESKPFRYDLQYKRAFLKGENLVELQFKFNKTSYETKSIQKWVPCFSMPSLTLAKAPLILFQERSLLFS